MKYLFFFILVYSFQTFAQVSYQVPQSWLRSDEETYQVFSQPSEVVDEKFIQGTDKIFQTVLKPLKPAADEKSWKLNGVMFDLTVSAQGTLGLLAMKGAPSASIAWVKKTKSKEIHDEEHHEPGYGLVVNDHGDHSTEDLIKTLMGTGQIKNETELRSNLNRVVSSFKNLTGGIESAGHGQWSLSRLRLDLSVSASGDLSPFTLVGGGLRVRLEWFPKKPIANGIHTEVQKNMNSFMNTMVTNLDNWSGQNQWLQQGLSLTTIRVGVGLTSKFNVGLVKSAAGAAFHAYFEKKKDAYQTFQHNPSHSFYQFSDESLPVVEQNWNSVLQISNQKHLASAVALKEKLYVVEPLQFHKGLAKAAKIGNYFLQRSKRMLSESDWIVRQVKIGTEISLSGGLALVTLTGATSCEMTFQPL